MVANNDEAPPEGAVWLDDAKCSRPACGWSGRIWIVVNPRLERCMPCPSCGGFQFSVMMPVVPNENRNVVLRGFTS